MGILKWFKDVKDKKEDLLKAVEKALTKAKRGSFADKNLLDMIGALDYSEIEEIMLPYYQELSADERGHIRKWFMESGFSERVKKIFKGKDNETKVKVLKIILNMRINPGTELLVELLADKDEGVRWLVSDIIKELMPRDGIKLLIDKLKYPLKYPPSRIGEVLIQYGDKALEALVQEVEEEQGKAIKAIAVLGLMPLGKVFNSLIKAINSPLEGLKLAALEALGEKGVKEYEELPTTVIRAINETVKGLIVDADPLTRIKAINVLSSLPIDNGDCLYKGTFDENKVVRINALTGLKRKNLSSYLEKIKNNNEHPLNYKV